MNVWEVIERKKWVNKHTKQETSIYGSVPYTNEEEKQNWFIKVSGYTLKNNLHNTVGAACVPLGGFATLQEAQTKCNRLNDLINGE